MQRFLFKLDDPNNAKIKRVSEDFNNFLMVGQHLDDSVQPEGTPVVRYIDYKLYSNFVLTTVTEQEVLPHVTGLKPGHRRRWMMSLFSF